MKFIVAFILIFVVLDIAIVGYVLYRRYSKKLPAGTVQQIQGQWKQIIAQDDYRHAIMDADKLLDYALSQMGLKGSLGAKLKKSPQLFTSINDVWRAHKVRNNIAHQIDYQVDAKTYKQTMLYFKQAFKDLKIF